MTTVVRTSLKAFLERVYHRIEAAILQPQFHESQRELLQAGFNALRKNSQGNPFNDPLAIFYLIAQAEGVEFDEQAEWLGAFCILYFLAGDLVDDVQDDDLAGKPFEGAGLPLALNTGLTYLFLGLEALQHAMRLESQPDLRIPYLDVFNRASISAVVGQHRDLLGGAGGQTPDDVLAIQQAKTRGIALVAECAALYARCEPATLDCYRRASEAMVQLVQIVDDISDIFGKSLSPDLLSQKLTYPLACFHAGATPEQRARLHSLVEAMPGSIKEIRKLLYEAGAIRESAQTIERLREEVHQTLALTGSASPALRTWLHLVDSFAATIYSPPLLDASRPLLLPEGTWHQRVRTMASDVVARLERFSPPELPCLLPWHQPQWMYDPKRGVIFYPDLDAQFEEVVAPQAELMGSTDLRAIGALLEDLAPCYLAHEFFHYWRHRAGRLTRDYWHEEAVANRLAIAYMQAHLPTLYPEAMERSRGLLAASQALSEQGHAILERCLTPGEPSQQKGYDVDLAEMARIQFAMLQRLYAQEPSLDHAIGELLAKRPLNSLRVPGDPQAVHEASDVS